MAANLSLAPKTLLSAPQSSLSPRLHQFPPHPFRFVSVTWSSTRSATPKLAVRAANDADYSSRRSNKNNEQRETIMLPGCDYNHWLIVMEFPKDPAPTREQMIETYLNTLATVLGRTSKDISSLMAGRNLYTPVTETIFLPNFCMEEAKKNMYAFSTTTYTGFQCTVSEETSEKFKGLPGVLWVLPDSYIDVKNKDYGGDKYVNGEIIPGKYPVYQPKKQREPKYESRRYERRRDGPPPDQIRQRQGATKSESASS
ncbi:hypothetical protein G4B88_028044 [Cannabis sativa]|uniref:MORF/ORRM1/DAG-like MORF domain-containing protein n=1 Tax=Cannabis sativa TaxID=3483 RepID=A0A7J6HKV7_CANSA|nr:hypothetical protein G4B88_028044 [Cannabis sativa]